MKQKSIIIVYVLLALTIGYLIYSDFIAPQPTTLREVVVSYGVPEILIPDTLYFAGERVPLEIPDVRERLDRELHVNTFWHSNTIFLMKRGRRWLPDIEKTLQEYGLPADLKYIPVIESDLLNKVSPSHAVGFWQLLKGTAKDFKLEVTNEVDERYDPIKSTVAAAKYLVKAKQKFGSWTNATASYNIGRRGLERVLNKQSVSSYYDLLLGEETSRYVFRVIALKMIFENPEKYGFNFSDDYLYHKENLKDILVEQSINNLKDWSFDQGINYKILKRHNPWLRKNTLTVKRAKTYNIKVPVLTEPSSGQNDSLHIDIEADTLYPDVRAFSISDIDE